VYNPNLSCNSNDIKINSVAQLPEAEGGQPPIATCNEGDMGLVDIKLTTQLNANSRYDVITWFGTEGNDPRDATVDNCYATSLPDVPDSTFILDLEAGADACLDVNSSPNPVDQYMFQVPFTCVDLKSLDIDGDVVDIPDGEADVFALVTWFQNNTLDCGTGPGQGMEPGVNPKCDISLLLGLDIEIISNQAIEIVKTPTTQAVAPGGQADFTLTVNNLGDVDLDTVVVTDAQCDAAPVYQSGDTGSDNILGIGESWVYTCSTTNVMAGFTNTAEVTAEEVDTNTVVMDDDDAQVTLLAPSIMVTKNPASQTVNPGGTASFSIVVTNNGNSDLVNVVLDDDTVNGCDTNIGALAQGASSAPILCSATNVQAPFTNTATATGDPDGGGDEVSDDDSADVNLSAPAVMIVKTPDQGVASGGTAMFTLTVTNPGSVNLNMVTVTDPNCDNNPVLQSGDIGVDGILTTTETWIYTCSTANVQAPFTNTGFVVATPIGGGDTVNDNDAAEVTLITSSIMIVKEADQVVAPGGTADFTLTVTNEGEADLESVVVTDALCDAAPVYQSGDTGSDGILATTETWIYTCSTSNVLADFTNTANVTGVPVGGGDSVNDDDTADVTVPPQLTLVKNVLGDGGAVAADFTLVLTGADGTHDGGTQVTSGTSLLVAAGVPYTLGELDDVDDYFQVGVICVDDTTTLEVPHPVTLAQSQVVTCTITNQADDVIIDLLTAVCIRNTPFVDYDVTTVEGNPVDVDITWIKNNGSNEVVETLLDQPLAGTLLWPGAAVNMMGDPIAWPGWSCDANGENCVQVNDGLVPTMQLQFDINPTVTSIVSYPPATANCAPPPPPPPPPPAPQVAIPMDHPVALLLMVLGVLGMGWYFRPARMRRYG
jgi:uncharacterized repeat protein (TIGR01451 family)